MEEYFFKPPAIACYSVSGFGGVRAAMQLRAMLAELGMSSIPSILPFPKVQDAFGDDLEPTSERADRSHAPLEHHELLDSYAQWQEQPVREHH